MTEEEDLEDLRISTRKAFDECTSEILYIEHYPILRDSTYTEILKEARAAYGQAVRGKCMISRDPYEANPPVALALAHLKAQREMLDRLLAQDAENPTIAAIRDVAHKVDAARDENADSADRTQFAIQKGFEDLKPSQEQIEYLAGKKRKRSIDGRKAQKKAVIGSDIAAEKNRAAADMRRALDKVSDDPDVKDGIHGAVLAACRRLCDWTDKAGRIHHGKFDALTTSKKYGEPQYAPLTDWRKNPIKPETLAKAFRERRKKSKRVTK